MWVTRSVQTPPNDPCFDISNLKQGRRLWVPGAAIDIDRICHPPVIGISAAADDRHLHLHRQDNGGELTLWELRRSHGMADRHTTASKFSCTGGRNVKTATLSPEENLLQYASSGSCWPC